MFFNLNRSIVKGSNVRSFDYIISFIDFYVVLKLNTVDVYSIQKKQIL